MWQVSAQGPRLKAGCTKQKGQPQRVALFTQVNGAGDRSRTYDLRITNALLYQLSYTGET